MLTGCGETLAVAESCTGGALGGAITDVPGSSRAFLGGVIAYSNELKVRLLGVASATLETHGAVSPETASAMARGVRERTGADWGLAVTGIAGPDGGSPGRPVGTVVLALAGPGPVADLRREQFDGDRAAVRAASVRVALELLLQRLRSRDA